jgi:hypothetical protein
MVQAFGLTGYGKNMPAFAKAMVRPIFAFAR